MNFAASDQAKAVAIIPARYASTRLPGKPLLKILDKPMIVWVAERAKAAHSISRVIVATDDRRIVEAVEKYHVEAMLTSTEHRSGTDRVAEAASQLENVDIVVNVQCDEPLISSETIDRVVEELSNDDEAMMLTTWEPITDLAEVTDPDTVKVVMDKGGRALYFSRLPVPYPRDAAQRCGSIEAALKGDFALKQHYKKHTGLYAYRYSFLLDFASWPQSDLEQVESLEQLRALERGATIRVIKACSTSIGVDTQADLDRVRAIFEKEKLAQSHLRWV